MIIQPEPRFRTAELFAAIALATDLGTGQPMEHALRTCLLAVRLAQHLGTSSGELQEVYDLALLRFIGCTAGAHETATMAGGEDLAFYAGIGPRFMGEMPEVVGYLLMHLARGSPPLRRARLVAAALADVHAAERAVTAHCEAARILAARMGLADALCHALAHAFERWDGKGFPDHLAGEAIPLCVRIVVVARDAVLWHRIGGNALVVQVLRRRRGRAYDPAVVDGLLGHSSELLAEVYGSPALERVLQAEPSPHRWVSGTHVDKILHACAEFTDLKSPFTHGHSLAVAFLAEAAAHVAGLSDAEAVAIRRAALLHDMGRLGIPNGIWEKPGPLTAAEWERVRLHPYLTERILSRCAALAPLAALAGSHHERLDGSGYHRGIPASLLPPSARILAAADSYQAMTQARPYRPAYSAEAAAQQLQAEADAGKLDREAVQAVLEAAGHIVTPVRPVWPAGLSDREVEVLHLITAGLTNREVAHQLNISPKTVGHHVEHIYNKIGVSTRAGAVLFALQHDLLAGQR
jgi:HD-GYP domain-containing protein (c-di-GMP phosphodiesterase class II)/DNA-binding CsgD family transcriptional regulator